MKLWVVALPVVFTTLAPVVAIAQDTAPPSCHYEPAGRTPVPNDPCWFPAMVSPAAVANVNRMLGKPQGVPRRITSVNDLASVEPNALPSIRIRLVGYDPGGGNE